ncbi:DUF4394 domain-containing protein [Parasegetibacter sp. NRK P23]|uniref:DUF4394 domain-containing protein n=1 Tax=Parasegetibacter sp. NRK P23 TaxID=2942999 RepID=UPI002044ABA9|nr:DUF4394 domain-containing protein [Parasegetibacter sp. NRK P23]MCM5528146.1 DUF4394 domain-containing protein [Parasegetibacter sp. NRK P23]
MKPSLTLSKAGMLALTGLLLSLSSCKKDKKDDMGQSIEAVDFYLLTTSNALIKYNGENPSMPLATTPISGIASGENIVSIDFRPATGQLYGISNMSKLFVINPDNGMAKQVGAEPFTPALNSTKVSIDFNPTVDRLRVITDKGQNLRMNPETGTVVATDGNINGVMNAAITGAAYTNSKAGATSTVLFDIDATTQKLYKQNPPNDGKLEEVGALKVNFSGVAAFDISPDNKVSIAALTTNSGTGLYFIDVNTGKATMVTKIAQAVIGLAIQSAPVAYATDASNGLIIFNPMMPSYMVSKPATGIATGDKIVGLDFRPANSQLYALGSTGRIYTVNTSNAAFTQVGNVFATALMGTEFGFDFNPTVDRIRLVSNMGQNLRLNPNDGTVAMVDGMLNPGTPAVTAAAYTNNFAGATTTTLFVVDAAAGKLFKQDPPNNGTLVEIGTLGGMFNGSNGFDIGGRTGMAYAVLTSGTATGIYSINLTTGRATMMSSFGTQVSAMAVSPGL